MTNERREQNKRRGVAARVQCVMMQMEGGVVTGTVVVVLRGFLIPPTFLSLSLSLAPPPRAAFSSLVPTTSSTVHTILSFFGGRVAKSALQLSYIVLQVVMDKTAVKILAKNLQNCIVFLSTAHFTRLECSSHSGVVVLYYYHLATRPKVGSSPSCFLSSSLSSDHTVPGKGGAVNSLESPPLSAIEGERDDCMQHLASRYTKGKYMYTYRLLYNSYCTHTHTSGANLILHLNLFRGQLYGKRRVFWRNIPSIYFIHAAVVR